MGRFEVLAFLRQNQFSDIAIVHVLKISNCLHKEQNNLQKHP